MSKPIRIALVGANWGATHVKAWQGVPGVEIAAICTSRRETAEKAAAEHGIARACWDWRALVADESIDIVDLTVRPTIRAPIAIAALEHRRHLLQPMPFALNLAQGLRLRDLAAASGKVAMVESLHRYAPAMIEMKRLLDSGAIGRVHSLRGYVRTGILFDPPPAYVYQWIVEADSGASALRNFGAQLLHTLTWMFGPVAEVAARIATNLPALRFTDGSRKANETADSAMLLARLESGADAAIDVSWVTPGFEGFALDAIGDAGRLIVTADVLGPQNARLRIARGVGASLADIEGLATPPGEDPRLLPLIRMCRRMAEAVRGDPLAVAEPSFDEAYAIMQLVEAAYLANEERRWVSPAEIAPG
jgi:predicted dehydrogenase